MATSDPATYEKVHHISVSDYINENIKYIACLIVGFVFSVLTFCDEKRSQNWCLATHISGGLFLIYVIFKYYAWYKTGFDH